METILKDLNPAQNAAVTSPASILQVLAPPGSGKTKTLTARAAYLIAHNGFNPRNIIVCTFTIKAAREMGERIEGLLGTDTSDKLILGTFHSVCRRLLMLHGYHIGLDSKFGIAHASDSKSMVTRIIKQNKLMIAPALARARISRYKADRKSAEKCAAECRLNGAKTSTTDEEVVVLYSEYEEQLKLANLLDFDDLLVRCADLLHAHPSCVANIEAVLIDEFQDTNHVQYDLVRLFAQQRKVISIVGDPDQSIYGWRSAKIENLDRMRNQYPDVHVATLKENYRSSGCILFAAQQVIEQDLARHQKALAPTHSLGLPAVMRKLRSAQVEAMWLVSEVQRLVTLMGGLLNYNDFAVLLRSALLSRLIERELGNAGIPYRLVGGHRFFDRVEVKLVLDYLRVIQHPQNTDALLRIVNVPPRNVGDSSTQNLTTEAAARKVSLWDIIVRFAQGRLKLSHSLSKRSEQGLASLVDAILTSRKRLSEKCEESLADFIESVVRKVKIREYLQQSYRTKEEYESRWDNIQELIAQATESTNAAKDVMLPQEQDDIQDPIPLSKGDFLYNFLANIALSTQTQKEENDQKKSFVTISTMHAAKGLEWPIVFIIGTYEGNIPHSRAEDADEERRLLYVAMTRAQSLLYLSCPKEDSMKKDTRLSNFLEPREVQALLTNRGPNITHDVITEVAQILRRSPPSMKEVENGRSRAKNLEDDQYSPKTSEDEDKQATESYGRETHSDDGYAGRKHKRGVKRLQDDFTACEKETKRSIIHHSEIATTMNKAKVYPTTEEMNTTTSTTTTFISANSLPKQESRVESLHFHNSSYSTKTTEPSSSTGEAAKRESKAQPGQMSLTSYFGPRGPEVRQKGIGDLDWGSTPILEPQLSRPPEDISSRVMDDVHPGQQQKPENDQTPLQIPQVSDAKPLQKTYGVRRSMNGWSARTHR